MLNICFFPTVISALILGICDFKMVLAAASLKQLNLIISLVQHGLRHCPPFKLWDKDQALIPTVILQGAHS